jgi:hypothetical protein
MKQKEKESAWNDFEASLTHPNLEKGELQAGSSIFFRLSKPCSVGTHFSFASGVLLLLVAVVPVVTAVTNGTVGMSGDSGEW